jgi:tetratricopeptide (TPR) repeat protein
LEARERVVETAQGNPLFAEQLVAALQDEGAVSVPASLHALLAARLDRLGPAERDLLRCAAVIGTTFTVDALIALVPEQARTFVERHLGALERKRLIRPSRPASPEFSFQHVLIQLAAYGSTTREDRATLHERFAEWLRAEAPGRTPSLDELLGYHLEQAVAERRVLGVSDDHDAELAVRSGEHLAAAGLRAAWRYDVAAAANLLSRAYMLLPASNPQRRTVMRRLAEAYQVVGRLADAESVLAMMLREAEAEGDLRLAQIARLELMRLKLFGGPDPINLQSILDETDGALDVFREAADEASLALAYYVRAYVHFRAAEMPEMERAARLALAHADRSARRREMMAARMLVAWAVVAGPTPVRGAISDCMQLVDVAGREHPMVLSDLATLRAMLGEIDDARTFLERARKLALERMRGRSPMMLIALARASVELAAGDVDAAERELGIALELARAARLRDTVSQTAARLSLAVVQGDAARAERLAALSRDNAPAESVAAQALWRAATARSTASRNDRREGRALAREAVHFVPTEMPNLRADLLVELAGTLRADGDATGASKAIGEAIDLYEQKGNVVAAARARSSWSRATSEQEEGSR